MALVRYIYIYLCKHALKSFVLLLCIYCEWKKAPVWACLYSGQVFSHFLPCLFTSASMTKKDSIKIILRILIESVHLS